ncbi:MAG: GGDEF domain-containing protein, partial [Azonexus sp.]|nr:GGDEF domain-containing protein [Azonexus sp.]
TDLLRRAATLDPVTGLSNRKSFDEIFEREFRHAIQSGQTIGLMMIDVEHLHGISELFGREEGDRVLRTLAQAVQAGIRPAQDTAARFATDKIVVLLPARNAEAMCTPGCDILAAAQQIRMPSGQAIAIHCGIAAIRPTPDADAHILISSAEVALFHATHEATGRVVCFDADEGDFIDCPCEGCSQRCGCDHA